MSNEPESPPAEIIAQAQELACGAEILPNGPMALARRIHEARCQGRVLRVKLGLDPTSCDLHLGHAVVFRKLKCFQDFGHQVILIIGGFTAQIGDPSGRNATRPPLSPEQVAVNAQTYLEQMDAILDISKTEVVNNVDWLASLDLKQMLQLASQVTVNQLLAKEAFGDRMDKQLPVSFHELFYPLLQGYDSVAVRADVELGGTDQRFNILQGRELQPHYGIDPPQLACLLPLLEGTDGQKKMSKTYGNYIGLKERPDDMFGKCMRIPDELILKYFQLASTLRMGEIDKIKAALDSGDNPKEAKEKLAQQIVTQYHGREAAEKALLDWNRVHKEKLAPDSMPLYPMIKPLPLFRLLHSPDSDCDGNSSLSLAASGSEAKRQIEGGGVKLDGTPITDPHYQVDVPAPGQERVLSVGKRKWLKLVSKDDATKLDES